MFNWFKPKKAVTAPQSSPVTAKPVPQTREEIVAGAMKNARLAREAIGEDNLAKLAALIQQHQQNRDVSPAAQAKKIIAQMDKDKVADFLKIMVHDEQTRH